MPRHRWHKPKSWYSPEPWDSNYQKKKKQTPNKKQTTKKKRSHGNRYSLTEALSLTMDYLSQSTWDDGIDDHDLLGLDLPIVTSQAGIDDVFLGMVPGNIVGLQYYSGTVSNHEMVSLVREPLNRYDKNAVKVENASGRQVGHIKRGLAEVLSYIVDNNYARIEGVVPRGNMNTYSMPVDISLYGPRCNQTVVLQRLRSRGHPVSMVEKRAGLLNTPSQSKSKKSSTYNPRSALGKSVMLSETEMKNEVDTLFDNLKSLDKTTEQEPSKCIIRKMYPHQKQALHWMLARESNDKLPTFWDKTPSGLYHNSLTNFTSAKRPDSVRGGILADEMGLGKTLTVIALVLHDFAKPEFSDLPPSLPSLPEEDEVDCNEPSTSQVKQEVKDEVVMIMDSQELPTISEEVIVIEDDSQNSNNNTTIVIKDDSPPIPCSSSTTSVTATGRPKRASAAKVKFIFNDDSDDNPSPEKKAKRKPAKMAAGPKVKGQSKPKGKGKGKKATGGDVSQKPLPGPSQPVALLPGPRPSINSVPGPSQPVASLPGPSPPINSVPGPSLPVASLPGPSQPINSVTGPSLPVDPLSGPSPPNISVPGPSKPMRAEVKGHHGDGDAAKPRATLILCPLSVLSNWIDQFREHVADELQVNVCLYYGAEKKKLKADYLKQQDVVITTYSTVAAEFKAKQEKATLQTIEWRRIVLDEGHTIRNHGTLQTQAAHALKAQCKWALTGTPIQNSIKDLWSLVAFLGVEPFKSTHTWWQRIITRPIANNDSAGIDRVRKLMDTLALRRMKSQKVNGKPLVDLPARNVVLQYVDFSEDEKKVYKTMEKDGRLAVSKYFQQGSVLNHYGDILAILMRLRQLCCHPALCAKAAANLCQAIDGNERTDEEKAQLVATLVSFLSQGADEECCICLDSIEDPVITRCAHVFCQRCIGEVINAEKERACCPLCRQAVSRDSLVHVPKDRSDTENEDTEREWHSSAKVDALMECLLTERAADKTTKSIVVSQFTSFLDLLKKPLTEKGFKFCRLDGSMSRIARTAAIREFSSNDPDSPQIFLLSLKAGGVGLNLTAASRLYLLDPAWNPACEEQCFDRCHRLGQTKDVTITKFLVRDSVEEAMLELQETKRQLMKNVFGGKNQTPEERRMNRVRDVKILMGMNKDKP
ncbi:helicase-like transcription factor isoform X1 [Strongylocentrotus purpuratus]|uniref:Helicase-like transcription factor n=1 Tax=Strongylocentrotus purpuratus TaxID=7668 RepID=A0A7M7NJE6_STRPU|nr:helicase-like transcription factor isoform X1 [Strongylocentrotus purpuratus]XP_030837525.1 helicase-like transcription factor isoform X1 [Strongylocentrotus purpuratus]